MIKKYHIFINKRFEEAHTWTNDKFSLDPNENHSRTRKNLDLTERYG